MTSTRPCDVSRPNRHQSLSLPQTELRRPRYWAGSTRPNLPHIHTNAQFINARRLSRKTYECQSINIKPVQPIMSLRSLVAQQEDYRGLALCSSVLSWATGAMAAVIGPELRSRGLGRASGGLGGCVAGVPPACLLLATPWLAIGRPTVCANRISSLPGEM